MSPALFETIKKEVVRTMDLKQMELVEICSLPGVGDLRPLYTRAYFAKALKAESGGDHQAAEKYLILACDKENEIPSG